MAGTVFIFIGSSVSFKTKGVLWEYVDKEKHKTHKKADSQFTHDQYLL